MPIEPAWLTSTVVSLATAIYDDRAFERLSILADGPEDAGCANADILNHCRQPGDHVRGCWLLDLLLGSKQFQATDGPITRQTAQTAAADWRQEAALSGPFE